MARDQRPFNVMELFRLDGEVAMITGAGDGIGRIAALTLAQAGATVAVSDIDEAGAAAVAGEIADLGGSARSYALDVGDAEAVVETVAGIAADLGRIDVLVNNAGMTERAAALETTLETWERMIRVNTTAAFVCAREAGRHMIRARRGRIVNVSSIMGLTGGGMYPNLAYHTSKGALANMTRALAAEWARHGVRVNAIAPTYVRTRTTEALRRDTAMVARIEARTPMGRFAEPQEMAGAILYLATDASSMVTGHTLPVDGGWLAI